MRKLDFCVYKNKGADRLHDNRAADQRLCCRYINSTSTLMRNFIVFGCSTLFVSDMVGIPKDRFSHDTAQIGI